LTIEAICKTTTLAERLPQETPGGLFVSATSELKSRLVRAATIRAARPSASFLKRVNEDMAEELRCDGRLAGYVVRAESDPGETTFITDSDAPFQMGFVVRDAGTEIARHFHLSVTRELTGTAEALLVRRGHCLLDIYSDEDLALTVALGAGDICLLLDGGHGLRMLEDTVLLELKQGPYAGQEDKKRF
jgi:hypothetical protein